MNKENYEAKNSKLERLVNSPYIHERYQAVKAGYGLDRLVHDTDFGLRADVAEQGYGLDFLARDPEPYVQRTVNDFLSSHSLTLDEWCQANPEKCVYPVLKNELEKAGLQVKEITLLNEDQIAKYRYVIPSMKKSLNEHFWILPGNDGYHSPSHALQAGPYLDRRATSADPARYFSEIRPALRMKNLGKTEIRVKDKLSLLGNKWTVLDVSDEEVLLFSDKSLKNSKFGKNGPDWWSSDVKKFIDKWIEWKLGKDDRQPSLSARISSASSRATQSYDENKPFEKGNWRLRF